MDAAATAGTFAIGTVRRSLCFARFNVCGCESCISVVWRQPGVAAATAQCGEDARSSPPPLVLFEYRSFCVDVTVVHIVRCRCWLNSPMRATNRSLVTREPSRDVLFCRGLLNHRLFCCQVRRSASRPRSPCSSRLRTLARVLKRPTSNRFVRFRLSELLCVVSLI